MEQFLAWTRNRALHLLTVILALVVLIAAKGHLAQFPIRSAVLMFLFAAAYLGAVVATGQAYFLYPTMILGAFGYFLLVYAAGASTVTFPLLSIPLAALLWRAGIRTQTMVEPRVPATLFRGMGLTAILFSGWALWDLHETISHDAVAVRGLPALTFLGYSLLYLAYHRTRSLATGACVACVYLVGAVLATLDATPDVPGFCYGPFLAMAAAAMVGYGGFLHRQKGGDLAEPFYISSLATLALGLAMSAFDSVMWQITSLLAAATCWRGYLSILRALPSVMRATSTERRTARIYYVATMAIGLLAVVVALAFQAAAGPSMAAVLLLLGALYVWVAVVRRRGPVEGRTPSVYSAAALVAAAIASLLGLIPSLGGPGAAWSLAEVRFLPLIVLCIAGFIVAQRLKLTCLFSEALSAAESCVVVAGIAFAFCLRYQPQPGWLGLLLAVGFALILLAHPLGRVSPGPRYTLALAVPFAGYVVASRVAPLSLVEVMAGIGVVVLLVAGQLRAKNPVAHLVTLYTWLVMSLATGLVGLITHGADGLLGQGLVLLVTGIVAGLTEGSWGTKAFQRVVHVCVCAMVAAIVAAGLMMGSLGWIGLALALGGLGFALGTLCSRSDAHGVTASLLFAIGYCLVLAVSPSFPLWITALAGLPLLAVLYLLSISIDKANPKLSFNIRDVGHLAAAALATLLLVRAWPVAGPGSLDTGDVCLALGYAMAGYVALYLILGLLRPWRWDYRLGAASALSLGGLFALAGAMDVPYYAIASPFSIVAVVWAGLGIMLKREGRDRGAIVAFATAVWLAVLCASLVMGAPDSQLSVARVGARVVSEALAEQTAAVSAGLAMSGAADHEWLVFLCNALVHLALLSTYRRDVFAYLVTLSLGLMAYTWLRTSTTHFTQDIMLYLVAAIAVVGGFSLLPSIGRALSRVTALPTLFVFTWQGALFSALPVFGVGGMGLMMYSIALVEHPNFCSACHNMTEFATEWQESSHGNIACVECHYEPGLEAMVKGKLSGLVQLVKYMTHSYGVGSHAEVSNDSCLRSNCHAASGPKPVPNETGYLRDIKFSHDKHVFKERWPWGAHLNCVSCHPHIAHGTKQKVSKETCFACHFYHGGNRPEQARADCQTCHGAPKEAVQGPGGESFTHAEIDKKYVNIKCYHCHKSVTTGDGSVSQARCGTSICHATPEEKKLSTTAMHEKHVSGHKFHCGQCHEVIEHGAAPMPKQMLTTADCTSCHSLDSHSVQEMVFMGTAISGFKGERSPKFASGVSCGGCHLERLSDEERKQHRASVTKKITQGTCDDCHTKKQDCVLARWPKEYKPKLEERREQADEILGKFKEARAKFKVGTDERSDVESLHKRFARYETWLRTLELDGSKGAHNAGLYEDVLDEIEEALEEIGDELDEVE